MTAPVAFLLGLAIGGGAAFIATWTYHDIVALGRHRQAKEH